ncbi:MAG: patatin-like phospholipase family protein [Solimonas sp.]
MDTTMHPCAHERTCVNRRRRLGIALLVAAVAGCAAPPLRLPPPPSRLSTAEPLGFDAPVRYVFESPEAFRLHSAQTLARMKQAAGDGPVNILALSGGGAGGAFGAGALVGWTRSGKRPEFQLVTGVSVGALIAPLAYLGSGWDQVLARALSGDSSGHLLQRNLTGMLFGAPSVYRGQPLVELVDRFVTDELLDAVAREYARGRQLLVETTDLDKGEPVIWDMGAIAARGGSAARVLFRDVLVASASIPVVFPPVMIRVRENGRIYDEMHVDGGDTVALFIGPEVAALVTDQAPPAGDVNVYALVNSQLGRFPSETKVSARSILVRGFDTTLTHGIRAALGLAFATAQRNGMKFQLTAIPNGLSAYTGPLDFEPEHMRRVFDFAANCGEHDQLWKGAGQSYSDAVRAREPGPDDIAGCPAVSSTAPAIAAEGSARER